MTEMKEQELKPCAHCGGEGHYCVTRKGGEHFVECVHQNASCSCIVGPFPTKREAIAAWNRRATDVSDELTAAYELGRQRERERLRAANAPQWTSEAPTEEGIYWVLQSGYKQELASAGHLPLVQLKHFPQDGDRDEFWRVRLLAGAFFHRNGSMFSVWAKEPELEWMLGSYDIRGWLKVKLPALPEEGRKNERD